MKAPFIIGVAGGTASGKTTVCEMIMKQLGASDNQKVVILHQDSFYKALTPDLIYLAENDNYNFDHPDSFDYQLIYETLDNLLQGKPTSIPVYDFKTHSRQKETITIQPPDVILFEGILVLYTRELRDKMDMKLFVDTDSDTRLSRRVLRDIQERNRSVDSVLTQYLRFVKPAFDEYILPTKKYADVIVPRGSENSVAIDLISQHIKKITDANALESSAKPAPAKEIYLPDKQSDLARSNSKDMSAFRPH